MSERKRPAIARIWRGRTTRDMADAVLMHEILAQRTVAVDARPLAGWRLAVPTTTLLDGMDSTVSRAFERALQALRAQGARIDDIVLPELRDVAAINATGGFSAAESWAWHRKRLAEREGAGQGEYGEWLVHRDSV